MFHNAVIHSQDQAEAAKGGVGQDVFFADLLSVGERLQSTLASVSGVHRPDRHSTDRDGAADWSQTRDIAYAAHTPRAGFGSGLAQTAVHECHVLVNTIPSLHEFRVCAIHSTEGLQWRPGSTACTRSRTMCRRALPIEKWEEAVFCHRSNKPKLFPLTPCCHFFLPALCLDLCSLSIGRRYSRHDCRRIRDLSRQTRHPSQPTH